MVLAVSPNTHRLSTSQAAARANCDRVTLLRWVREGLITGYVFKGRSPQGNRYEFDPEEIDAFQAERWERAQAQTQKTPK